VGKLIKKIKSYKMRKMKTEVHVMNITDVLNYVVNADGYSEWDRYGFTKGMFDALFSERRLTADTCRRLWSDGLVPRVVVERECNGSGHTLDFRQLSAEVVTQIHKI
jgi:hypothetical protein